MTDQQYLILLALAPAGSVVLVGMIFLHRRRIYAAWAKVSAIVAAIAGVGWGVLGFVLLHSRSYHLTRDVYYRLVGIKGMLCGIAIGFTLSILIARPYRTKDIETLAA